MSARLDKKRPGPAGGVIISRKVLDKAAATSIAMGNAGVETSPGERLLARLHGRQLAHAVAAGGIVSAIVHAACGDDWIRSLASRLGITVAARGACYEISRPEDLTR